MVLLWNQSFTDHWLVVAPIGASTPLPSAETFLGRCKEGVRAAAMMTSIRRALFRGCGGSFGRDRA